MNALHIFTKIGFTAIKELKRLQETASFGVFGVQPGDCPAEIGGQILAGSSGSLCTYTQSLSLLPVNVEQLEVVLAMRSSVGGKDVPQPCDVLRKGSRAIIATIAGPGFTQIVLCIHGVLAFRL